MIESFWHWLCLVLVVEAITELIVDAKITEGLRAFVRKRAFPNLAELDDFPSDDPPTGPWHYRFLDGLVGCGYCASVWVAAPVALFAPWIYCFGDSSLVFAWAWLVNWVFALFVLHRCSNWLHVVYSLVRHGRVKSHEVTLTEVTLVKKGEE